MNPHATPAAPEAFTTLPALIGGHARQAPARIALRCGDAALSYAELDARMDRVAAALQRDGVARREAVAICGAAAVDYVVLFMGALRAGIAVAPLAPGATTASLAAMVVDAQARHFFADGEIALQLADQAGLPPITPLDGPGFEAWLAPAGARPQPVDIAPGDPFNLIYSSGTTGTPKGIAQPHAMRWAHVQRSRPYGYGPASVTLAATPLYSNTTLVALIPALAHGGCVVLMPRFDALAYLELALRHRATHSMLVPVQYQRLLAHPRFGDFDLSAFVMKFCTSAPFSAALKAEVLARWPGGLVEYYGMTEGGGTCILEAHQQRDKLHTVGRPGPGSEFHLIAEDGRALPAGSAEAGEIVGRSPGMMSGYHGQPELTRAAEWFDAEGRRYIRTGDIGRFDADGFLTLIDRRKDMIISGGFNIYPSDLEAQLAAHPAVAEAAVVGVPSERWGETPVARVVLRAGSKATAAELLQWANERLGKVQRLADLQLCAELPRSAIGKVLKRELRAQVLGG
ncbi:Acyl-CoA synthetase (AMP-forming)/AMP-acid ligase II [Rubrivivax sp. A210]|uniref:class I adenylate-forming enzyme family protein n=1 Tax=Rubrivivax sp. A210 TaxID=2772301 RepID=UPI00191AA07B|nr:class I adenylate-forming enzyme family protein [Rubrivivax sp. A210]CAD5373241.1 Acyl-CoA synthetase (AMP-forming)/AMP-acid ligase II [Rubrivivax sp. A210]